MNKPTLHEVENAIRQLERTSVPSHLGMMKSACLDDLKDIKSHYQEYPPQEVHNAILAANSLTRMQ